MHHGCAFFLSMVIMVSAIILGAVLMGVSVKLVDFRAASIMINSITKVYDNTTVYLPGR